MRFTAAELAEIRQLFRKRVQSVEPARRARSRHTTTQLLPTLALRVEAVEPDADAVLRAGELAALLGVTPSTIRRWASDGRVPYLRTPTRERRFRWGEVRARIQDHA